MAGALIVAGSAVFFAGAQLGVPRVFMERDPDRRLDILEANRGRWRAAQPLYALGPLIVSVAVGLLASASASTGARTAFWLAATALLLGSLAWTWSVYQRAVRIADFARGRLPGWPFAAYVLLTVAGLAAVGLGLLPTAVAGWVPAVTLAADVVFLLAFLRFRDIPPFVFYLLLVVVGVVVTATPDALAS